MKQLATPRLVIAGLGDSVGKSVVGLGIAHELRRRGESVSCCVIGPNLGQAIIYQRITGRYVRCLDRRLLTPAQFMQTLYQASLGSNLTIIEGHDGLFDGHPLGSLYGSDAELAGVTKTPVTLVAPTSRLSTSEAAMIKGFSSFAQGVTFAGVIVNSGRSQAQLDAARLGEFRDCLKKFEAPTLLGGLPYVKAIEQRLPTDLSQSENYTSLPHNFFVELGATIGKYLDLDEILKRAAYAPPVEVIDAREENYRRRTKIAVSNDPCFSVGFQDNLDLMRFYGAEIVNFSPLADQSLPSKIGAVYLTGGYLANYGEELAQNTSMLQSLRQFSKSGGVIISEGAGTAYLCKDFKASKDGPRVTGVGLIEARAKPGNRNLAYNELVTTGESVFGHSGLSVKSINTHEFSFFEIQDELRCMKISSGVIDEHLLDGFRPTPKMLCTSAFVHLGSNPEVARRIVDLASDFASD